MAGARPRVRVRAGKGQKKAPKPFSRPEIFSKPKELQLLFQAFRDGEVGADILRPRLQTESMEHGRGTGILRNFAFRKFKEKSFLSRRRKKALPSSSGSSSSTFPGFGKYTSADGGLRLPSVAISTLGSNDLADFLFFLRKSKTAIRFLCKSYPNRSIPIQDCCVS